MDDNQIEKGNESNMMRILNKKKSRKSILKSTYLKQSLDYYNQEYFQACNQKLEGNSIMKTWKVERKKN